MLRESVFPIKGLLAVGANVLALTYVENGVSSEVLLPSEHLVALDAGEDALRPPGVVSTFPQGELAVHGVGVRVLGEVVLPEEGLAAVKAGVRLLARVEDPVARQVLVALEGFAARLARVGPLLAVGRHVGVQVLPPTETGATFFAHVPLTLADTMTCQKDKLASRYFISKDAFSISYGHISSSRTTA